MGSTYSFYTNDTQLQLAYDTALKFHAGQTRRGGDDYITHPLMVMAWIATYCKDSAIIQELERVAMLHDILEDTDCTVEELKRLGFSDEVVDAVVAMTKKDDEDYEVYIERVKQNKLARVVKIFDMYHNLSDQPTEKQKTKYKKSIQYLLKE
jgi:(p)ppGpp synthase/HD superfamily hydrolase